MTRCVVCSVAEAVTRYGRCEGCARIHTTRRTGLDTALINGWTRWEEDDRAWYVVACHPHGLTLEQIGELFGLTRERIRQIEAIALAKLLVAHPDLREYLEVVGRAAVGVPKSARGELPAASEVA